MSKDDAAKPLVAVVGATGSQGSAVFRTVSESSLFRSRALVRNPASDRAKGLLASVDAVVKPEVAKALLSEKDSLVAAFRGADAVYAYTALDESAEEEIEWGRNIADACKTAGVKFLVWSSTPSAVKISKGKIPVDAYDCKVKVEEYIQSIDLEATYIYLGGFWENLFKFHYLQTSRASEHPAQVDIKISAPIFPVEKPQAWTSIQRDLGPIVTSLIAGGLGIIPGYASELRYRHTVTCSPLISWGDMEDIMRQILKRKVEHHVITKEEMIANGHGSLLPIYEFGANYDVFQDAPPFPDEVLLQLVDKVRELESSISGKAKDTSPLLDDFASFVKRTVVPHVARAEEELQKA